MQFESSIKSVEIMALELDPPVVMDAGATVADVIKMMRERGEGYALLTENDRLAGIFTERDVLLKVVGVAGAGGRPVAELMTAGPIAVGQREPVRNAVFHMTRGGFRSVPVVDREQRVVGCVRQKDLGRYVVQHFADRILNLPPDPDQVAKSPEGG
ncbi:MAG: CBS domain-containing protein [Planctomycetota bacterium]|jgi:CBS domain-containing protein